MPKTGLKGAVVALAVLLSATTYAAGRGFGGGHGGGGGGHFGGGGMHFGGGGMRGGGMNFGGGGARFGGGHFGGGGMRFGGANFGGGGMRYGGAHFGGVRQFGGPRFGGARHFGGARFGGVPRYSAGRGYSRSYAVRGAGNRAAFRSSRAANRAALRASRTGNAAAFNRNGNGRNLNGRALRDANRRTNAVRTALGGAAVAGALHNHANLHNPNWRNNIASNAALAGWKNGHGNGWWHNGGWWRHRHGGYGWVGPLFWPFAYYDFYNYALWGGGYDDSFWDYGYGDIYAGLFSPYGYDELAGYMPQYSGGGSGGPPPSGPVTSGPATSGPATTGSAPPAPAADAPSEQLAQMCGQDGRDIAGLPIDQIQSAINPNDEQRAALDDLANASVKAAQDIKAACPTSIALTAPSRLAAMQKRIEALIGAVQTVQPALDKFYGLLNDEQKARLTALGKNQREDKEAKNEEAKTENPPNATTPQDCGGAIPEWPTQKITDALQPTEAQRDSLNALAAASAKAADMLKTSCQPSAALTPPARLAAVGQRLDTLLQATKTVSVALNDFYGKLTDEQKAQFEAIGPKQNGLSSGSASQRSDASEPRSRHRRGHRNDVAAMRNMIRHFITW